MSMPLKYDMPGPQSLNGNGDSLQSLWPTFPIVILTDAAGLFHNLLIGREITIAGATDPNHNGVFVVTSVIAADQLWYWNPAVTSGEVPFTGTWATSFVSPGTILAYDAAEVEDDAKMLSGPHTGAGGSVPPVAWPNPGPNDVWEGPYGPELKDWDNTSHPGADLTQGGWVPPNKALKYDSDIPAGWYTRTSTKNKYSRREPEIPLITDPT